MAEEDDFEHVQRIKRETVLREWIAQTMKLASLPETDWHSWLADG
jgi:hypothetical protein